ncbi:MAG: helix-turn-helix domain-containing protein [Salinimicrobium sp.]
MIIHNFGHNHSYEAALNLSTNIFLLIFALGTIQGFLLSLLILFKKQQKLYNYFFGTFLLLLALASAKIILQENIPGFLDDFHFPLLYKFAFGPLLYLFVKDLLYPKNTNFKAAAPHFFATLLFDILLRLCLPLFGLKNSDPGVQLFNFYGLNIGSLIFNFVYWLMAAKLLFGFRRNRKLNLQLKDNRIIFHLKRILAIDLVSSLSALIFIVLTIYNQSYSIGEFHSYYVNYLVITFYIYFLSYTVYAFPEIELLTPKIPSVKPKTSCQEKPLLDDLNNKITKNRYFTDPDLNLNKLANQLEISPRELSRIINAEAEQNFNDFLNQYRIEHFKELLKDDLLSIEGMAYDAGFKSKTSFYRAFKKSTGLTPLQYKKSVKQVPNHEIDTPDSP